MPLNKEDDRRGAAGHSAPTAFAEGLTVPGSLLGSRATGTKPKAFPLRAFLE